MSPTTTLDSAAIAAELDGLGVRHDLAFKAAPAAPVNATITEKAGTGRVVAIVAVTGVEDEVNDIILPGAFRASLAKRMPKVCWHHAWEEPVGRTLAIEEWHPGDPRLPKQTKEGRPWPQAAGALVATAEFNLKSDRGREAFEAVRFFSESNECEWSIGYKVQPGQSAKDKQGRRHIKALDLFEYSFVLFGAAPLSMTLSMKSLQPLTDRWQAAVEAVEGKSGDGADEPVGGPQEPAGAEPDDVDTLHSLAMDEIEWDLVDVAPIPPITVIDEKALEEAGDWRFEVGRKLDLDARRRAVKAGTAMPDGSYPIDDEHDLRAALAWVEEKSIDDENVRRHVARMATVLDRVDLLALPGGPEVKEGGADRNRGGAENLRNYYLHGAGAAQIAWGTDGDWQRCVDIAGKHMTLERAKGYCALRHKEATGSYPGRGHGHGHGKKDAQVLVPEPEVKKAEEMIGSGVMVALAVPGDIAGGLAVTDGNPAEALHCTLAFLGDAADLNDNARSSLLAAATAFAGFCPPLSGTIGGIGMFPDAGSGVPTWVPVDVPLLGAVRDRLVTLLGDTVFPVASNHGFTPHITLGYDIGAHTPVPSTPVTFTHLVVAVGAEKHLLPLGAALTSGYDPTLDEDDSPDEVKANAAAMGSFEELRRRIEAAVRDLFEPDLPGDEEPRPRPDTYTCIEATYPTRVIVTRMKGDDSQSYEIDWVLASDGSVVLSDPEKVTLVLGVIEDDPDTDDMDGGSDTADVMDADGPDIGEAPEAALTRYVAGLLADLTDNVEAIPVEGKAGRVLSGVNTTRLRAAIQNLLTVLEAAGVDNILPPAKEDVATEKRVDEGHSAGWVQTPETTSVGAKSADVLTIDHKSLMADLFGE